MVLVYVVYALVIFQGILLLLYLTGKGYIISMMLELAYITLRVFLHVFKSLLRWILPPQRKSLRDDTALVTGAASGIGRLIALRLADKGTSGLTYLLNSIYSSKLESFGMCNKGKEFPSFLDIEQEACR